MDSSHNHRLHSVAPTLMNESFSQAPTPQPGSVAPSIHEKSEHHDDHYDNERMICSRCREDIESVDDAQIVSKGDLSAEKETKLVTWDGPNDPQKPMNMSTMRKVAIVISTGAMTFCVSFGSSVFSTTTTVTAEKFNVSGEVMILGVSLYVLGFALGPMVWGPLSEVYGRTRPLWAGMIAFCIFQVPVAVAQNLQTIFVCRFFAGLFGSAPLAIVGGMFVDYLSPLQMGVANAAFSGSVMCGPTLGPVLGSFITESHLGWRWTSWITLIMTVFFTTLAWIVTPETFEPTLLRWKAQRLRQETKDWSLHSKSEEHQLDLQTLVTKYLKKPLVMIVKEPILIILTFYTTLVYGLLYLTFEAFPISFQGERGWKPTVATLPFLGILIGVIIASIIVAVFTQTWYAKRLALRGKPVPEDRIPLMMLGSILLPIGLFWFAWTSSPSISWVPQVISSAFIGAGIVLIFMGCIVYMIDTYLLNANSAIAINTFIRSVVAAAFPLFAGYMYKGMGTAWATSLLAFVSVAMIPFPIVFWFYGEKIRGWSKFAFVL